MRLINSIKPDLTIDKLKKGIPVTIAALGDSLTNGWMEKKGYLDFLEEMLLKKYPGSSVTIINKGIPGDTSGGGLKRLQADVIKNKPDMVFVQFALNDAFTGYSPSEFSMNIQKIIDRLKKSINPEIILITSVYLGFSAMGGVANVFYNILYNIAERNNVSVAAVDEYWEKNIKDISHFLSFVQDDMIHPNEAGYRLMAEAIMELF